MGREMMAAQQEATVQTIPMRMKRFFREVRAELKKVSWPSRQELISHTGVVFIAVAFVGVLIWIMDTLLTKIIGFLIR